MDTIELNVSMHYHSNYWNKFIYQWQHRTAIFNYILPLWHFKNIYILMAKNFVIVLTKISNFQTANVTMFEADQYGESIWKFIDLLSILLNWSWINKINVNRRTCCKLMKKLVIVIPNQFGFDCIQWGYSFCQYNK